MSNDTPMIGKTVGDRYVLEELIGEGGMGKVFRATDKKLSRPVAIKLLHPQRSQKAGADERFVREARIGAQLSHENLVQTYDFGRDGNSLFLAVEFLEGRDLATRLRAQGPLAEVEVAAVAAQVAAGLAAAHAKHLVHRDLKPENIVLISESPLQCKVIDFGMAVASVEVANLPRLTTDGTIGGTPRYMAPEQLRGLDPIGASDVYALGCVLFELACGEPPYNLDALGEVAAHHLYAPIPDLSQRRRDLSPVFCELVRRCLGKSPDSRPTMQQICVRLAEIDGSAGRRRHTRRTTRAPRVERGMFEISDQPTESLTAEEARTLAAVTAGTVAIRGEVDTEVIMALRASGFEIVDDAKLPPDGALICIGLGDEELATICQEYALVLADADSGQMDRVAHLLRIGVAEVVISPVQTDRLIIKLLRAIRIHARGVKGSVP